MKAVVGHAGLMKGEVFSRLISHTVIPAKAGSP